MADVSGGIFRELVMGNTVEWSGGFVVPAGQGRWSISLDG